MHGATIHKNWNGSGSFNRSRLEKIKVKPISGSKIITLGQTDERDVNWRPYTNSL
jgi:hypothetical protein